MNYIKQIQSENAELKAGIEACKLEILEFRKHLSSSKFQCGDRLDNYINTRDAMNWAQSIFDTLPR